MEERTLDDDIEKNLKPKTGEDGEETVEEETENGGEVILDIPVIDEDNEELADMTPEQAAAYIKQREEEQARLLKQKDDLKAEAAAAEAAGENDRAEELYYNILELDPADLTANVGYARKITKDFSLYDDFDSVKEIYEKGVDNAGEEFTAAIKENCARNIGAQIAKLKMEEQELSAKVEEKRVSRRAAFREDYNRKLKRFAIMGVVFVALVFFTAFFAVKINSVGSADSKSALFLILTIVFGVLAFADLVFFLIATNKFSTAAHRVRENERDSATKDGRALMALREKIAFLNDIIA